MIVDDKSKLYRVQVKTTSRKYKNTVFVVDLRISGGNKTRLYKKLFNENMYDLVYILTEFGDVYLIPTTNIKSNTFNLTSKYDQFRVVFPAGLCKSLAS